MSYQELRNGPFSIYNDTIWSRMRFSDTKSGVLPNRAVLPRQYIKNGAGRRGNPVIRYVRDDAQ